MAFKALALASLALIATTAAIFLATSAPSRATKVSFDRFLHHKNRYNKMYATKQEMQYRYAIFAETMAEVEAHNATTSSYKQGENKFSDLTFEEFKAKYLSKEVMHNTLVEEQEGSIDKKHKDWVAEGKVTQVKDQGQCGSCWAFSTIGSLESAYAIFKNQSILASEQELVDCSWDQGNNGCNGGLMDAAFKYIIENQVSGEEEYPYTARNEKCDVPKGKDKFAVAGYSYLKSSDVVGLAAALDNQPVSVAIEVQSDFQRYESGVYVPHLKNCGKGLNHGVLAAGYYNDVEKPYFLVKNSWGEDWGDKGYIKMAIGTGRGTCGIANDWDVYPSL